MKKVLIATVGLTLLIGSAYTYEYVGGKCTGSDKCKACKNCKYCKHCAKEGGTCRVCK